MTRARTTITPSIIRAGRSCSPGTPDHGGFPDHRGFRVFRFKVFQGDLWSVRGMAHREQAYATDGARARGGRSVGPARFPLTDEEKNILSRAATIRIRRGARRETGRHEPRRLRPRNGRRWSRLSLGRNAPGRLYRSVHLRGFRQRRLRSAIVRRVPLQRTRAGVYLPVVYLPRPKLHQSAAVASTLNLGPGLAFDGNGPLAIWIKNRFSTRMIRQRRPRVFRRVADGRTDVADRRAGSRKDTARRPAARDGRPIQSVGRTTDIEHERKWRSRIVLEAKPSRIQYRLFPWREANSSGIRIATRRERIQFAPPHG